MNGRERESVVVKVSLLKLGSTFASNIRLSRGRGRSGIESRLGRDFLPVETDPGDHPASCKMVTGFFPGLTV